MCGLPLPAGHTAQASLIGSSGWTIFIFSEYRWGLKTSNLGRTAAVRNDNKFVKWLFQDWRRAGQNVRGQE